MSLEGGEGWQAACYFQSSGLPNGQDELGGQHCGQAGESPRMSWKTQPWSPGSWHDWFLPTPYPPPQTPSQGLLVPSHKKNMEKGKTART